MTDLSKLLDNGEQYVRKALIEDREKSLLAFYHLIAPPGRQDEMIVATWENDIQKQITIAVVKDHAKKLGAVAAIFLGEAWMRKSADLDPPPEFMNTPPSESPDRIETVMIIATDGRETRMRSLEMMRNKPNGRITALVNMSPGGDEPQKLGGRLIDGIITPPTSH